MPTPGFTETSHFAISPASTPKQKRFVEEYMIDLNATQAAIRAGYSYKTAEQQGYQLLQKTSVSNAITAAMKARSERMEIDQDWVLERLRKNYERAMRHRKVRDKAGNSIGEYVYNGSVANRALELIGKHLAMFTERVDHSGEVTITAIKRIIVDPGNR